jgi:hypothetical protein
MPAQPAALRRWHAAAESKDPALLDELLADEVAFRSPAVCAPQQGKTLTASYLSAALKVLAPLPYVSQWHDHASAVLEFEADLEGVYVQDVDILRWNGEGSWSASRSWCARCAGCKAGRADGTPAGRRPALTYPP